MSVRGQWVAALPAAGVVLGLAIGETVGRVQGRREQRRRGASYPRPWDGHRAAPISGRDGARARAVCKECGVMCELRGVRGRLFKRWRHVAG